MIVLKLLGLPHTPQSTVKRRKFTGSYAEIVNIPVVSNDPIQDPDSGLLLYMVDYDPVP